ncbi:MAG TPA: DUF4873 domain-containing protein, partial [Actinocrinis sp.]|uniref:DUF4873 domain-containing protein n=1 Tax=Actinocrinis sp. TaxID=1920516 RepID=UPI002DDC925E
MPGLDDEDCHPHDRNPNDDHTDDSYQGSATLTVADHDFHVHVSLRGYFEPIDGRYHWYGRLDPDPALISALGSGRTSAVLTTPHGSAPCDISEPDPWNRYRVIGLSTPPFPAATTPAPDTPSTPSMPSPSHPYPHPHLHIAIIGAGFGGLGTAIRLRQAGIKDFAIFERADAIGGTWRDNTYPGCACDVPSHLYSFSFAANPRWSHSFSRQPEIKAYLEDVTDRYALRRHIRFNTEVTEARWDDAAKHWRLSTSRGDFTADAVVSAASPLSEPLLPDIPGLAAFPGEVFHSARWNHDHDLTGKRVAVIGTGASAVQIVPELLPAVGSLFLFQRTPAWVLPRPDRHLTAVERRIYQHVPPVQRLTRLGIYLAHESSVGAFVKHPWQLKVAQRLALRTLKKTIHDETLRAKLTPTYVMGCKRVLLSNDFYPALNRPNTTVIASGLAKIDGSTLIAQDGSAHEADVLVFATGFHAVDMPIAKRIHGVGGMNLAEHWAGNPHALRGTTVGGFPNLFLIIGPNTVLGHSSMVHIIESQLNYVIDYLRTLKRRGVAALDVRAEAQDRWCAEVERRMASTVWATGGCVSWYLNAAGRNPTLWPASTLRFRRETRRIDLD